LEKIDAEAEDMAQRVVVEVACDEAGKHSGIVRTVQLSFDGATYEIDLCSAHVKHVDEVLTMVVQHGRKVGASTRAAARSTRQQRQSSRADSEAARAWGRANGYKVSERGRISQEVMVAYQHRNNPPAAKFSAA
jgi:Lsr2